MTITYLENFLEKLFYYLAKVVIYCLICWNVFALLIIQKNNKIIEEQEKMLEINNLQIIAEELQKEEYLENNLAMMRTSETRILELENLRVKNTENDTSKLETSIEDIQEFKVSENYTPTEEERQFAYKIAFAEAGTEGSIGQTLVINVAINNMKKNGLSSLIEEFKAEGRYQSVINGEVYNAGKVVNLSDVPQEVKEAVDEAFKYDYSEQILKQQAETLGITDPKYWKGGAMYFYNPAACSERQNNLRENVKVKFQYGNHIFYCYWDEA